MCVLSLFLLQREAPFLISTHRRGGTAIGIWTVGILTITSFSSSLAFLWLILVLVTQVGVCDHMCSCLQIMGPTQICFVVSTHNAH